MQNISSKSINSQLLLIILVCLVLYVAKPLLVPVSFSILFAMLMTPVANKLEAKGFSRTNSTIASVFILLLVISLVVGLIVMQGVAMSDDWPEMEKKVRKFIEQIIVFSEENLNISREKIESFVKEKSKSFGEGGKQIIAFFNSLLSTLGSFVVVLVFMFLFMLQREKYEIFFLKLYKNGNPDESKKVLGDICKVAQRYLFGRVLSIIILTVLYFAALAIIGVKNAFLLSVIAALATIIPYVGTVAGSLFPCLMAIITEDSIAPAIAVLAAIFLIQTVDNYFIEPYIVGGEVNLSAFFSIFGLMAGGLLWGIAGVILFLPLLGILKIVFEHVKELEPYAYLIGDQKSKSPIEKKLEKLWKSFKKK